MSIPAIASPSLAEADGDTVVQCLVEQLHQRLRSPAAIHASSFGSAIGGFSNAAASPCRKIAAMLPSATSARASVKAARSRDGSALTTSRANGDLLMPVDASGAGRAGGIGGYGQGAETIAEQVGHQHFAGHIVAERRDRADRFQRRHRSQYAG